MRSTCVPSDWPLSLSDGHDLTGRLDAISVGVWVPSILALGAFLLAGSDRKQGSRTTQLICSWAVPSPWSCLSASPPTECSGLVESTGSRLHWLDLRRSFQAQAARYDRVSLLAETRSTCSLSKPADLRVWSYAPSPRGRGWRGTWHGSRRNAPEARGRALRGFWAGRTCPWSRPSRAQSRSEARRFR